MYVSKKSTNLFFFFSIASFLSGLERQFVHSTRHRLHCLL